MSFQEVLKRIGVKNKTIRALQEEDFDMDTLRGIPNKNMISSLKEASVPAANAIRIRRWNQLMRKTAKSSRNTSRNLFNSPPNNPLLYHQTSVSIDLLDELAHNNDLRVYLDELMKERMKDLYYLDEPIQLKEYTQDRTRVTYTSRFPKNRKGIFYNWYIEKEGEPVNAFHLSLHHASNRTEFQEVEIGSFHVKMDNRYGTIRKILMNLVNGVYVISICKGSRYGYIDEVAERIVAILMEYFTNTGRRAIRGTYC
jgi:hypothetical protein